MSARRRLEDPTRDYYKEEVERQLCELPCDEETEEDSSDEEE